MLITVVTSQRVPAVPRPRIAVGDPAREEGLPMRLLAVCVCVCVYERAHARGRCVCARACARAFACAYACVRADDETRRRRILADDFNEEKLLVVSS